MILREHKKIIVIIITNMYKCMYVSVPLFRVMVSKCCIFLYNQKEKKENNGDKNKRIIIKKFIFFPISLIKDNPKHSLAKILRLMHHLVAK